MEALIGDETRLSSACWRWGCIIDTETCGGESGVAAPPPSGDIWSLIYLWQSMEGLSGEAVLSSLWQDQCLPWQSVVDHISQHRAWLRTEVVLRLSRVGRCCLLNEPHLRDVSSGAGVGQRAYGAAGLKSEGLMGCSSPSTHPLRKTIVQSWHSSRWMTCHLGLNGAF